MVRSKEYGFFSLCVLKQAINIDKSSDEQKLIYQLRLIRLLAQKGYDRIYTEKLLNFIKRYVRFENEETENLFDKEIERITPTFNAMGINEYIEHTIREEAVIPNDGC